ncbi:hypothetical protein Tco_0927668 [Tanacetum coccineum]
MEAMKFVVPIIAMPMRLDQPINAQLVVEIGVGKEVVRNNKCMLMRANIDEIMNEVAASNQGKNIRDKAKKIRDDLETKKDEEIDATMAANMFHLYLKQDVAFLFDSNYYRKYEKKNVKEILESSTNGRKDKDRVMQGVKWWKNIVLVKSFEEIEVDMTQIALGLEMSNVNFIWVQWFPKGENNMTIKEALPLSSVKEDNKFDVPIIAMPMHLDQPINARLVAEIKMGKEVVRNNEGVLMGDLNLDPLLDIPSELHTTNGLPLHLMPSLKNAFDMGKPWFSEILTILKSNLSIYDMIQHWAPVAVSAMRIPFVLFITTSATIAANMFHLYLKQDVAFPFDLNYYHNKRVVPVDPLVVDYVDVESEQNTDITQIALGLEMSNVNFIWVERFPNEENNMTIKEALPLGFVESVKTKVMEAMKFDVPIIVMPMHLDQPVNALLVVEIGIGKHVVRNNKDVLMGAKVAEIMNEVVAGNLGKNIRHKAKKISDDLETRGDEEIEFVVDELLQLCQSSHKL